MIWRLLQYQWMYIPHFLVCFVNFVMLILIDAPRNDVLRTLQIKGFLVTYMVCFLCYLWILMQMIFPPDDIPSPVFTLEYMFVHILIHGMLLSHSMFHIVAEISGSFHIAFVMFLQELFQWILLIFYFFVGAVDFRICFAIGVLILWVMNSLKMFMTGVDITQYGKYTQAALFLVRLFVLLFWAIVFLIDTNYYFIFCCFVIGEFVILLLYAISFIKT